MHVMSNEMNYDEILDKFDELHNYIDIIKTRIINEINYSLT